MDLKSIYQILLQPLSLLSQLFGCCPRSSCCWFCVSEATYCSVPPQVNCEPDLGHQIDMNGEVRGQPSQPGTNCVKTQLCRGGPLVIIAVTSPPATAGNSCDLTRAATLSFAISSPNISCHKRPGKMENMRMVSTHTNITL